MKKTSCESKISEFQHDSLTIQLKSTGQSKINIRKAPHVYRIITLTPFVIIHNLLEISYYPPLHMQYLNSPFKETNKT